MATLDKDNKKKSGPEKSTATFTTRCDDVGSWNNVFQ